MNKQTIKLSQKSRKLFKNITKNQKKDEKAMDPDQKKTTKRNGE